MKKKGFKVIDYADVSTLDDFIMDAGTLQEQVKDTERSQREDDIKYDNQHVRQSIVHLREDAVLIVAHLSNLELGLRVVAKELGRFRIRINLFLALMTTAIILLVLKI